MMGLLDSLNSLSSTLDTVFSSVHVVEPVRRSSRLDCCFLTTLLGRVDQAAQEFLAVGSEQVRLLRGQVGADALDLLRDAQQLPIGVGVPLPPQTEHGKRGIVGLASGFGVVGAGDMLIFGVV